MADPLVSVIVPTYNRAYCLRRALDSILTQTHSRLEVILIDDGSTDGTMDLVSNIYGHDSRVKYYYQQNVGVTAARNRGLTRASGDFIAFLDSDDVWRPWKLALQLACFQLCPALGMVWTDMEAINPQGNVADPTYLRTMYHAFRWFKTADLFPRSYAVKKENLPPGQVGARLFVGDIFSQMFMGNLVHTSTVLLRRERFEKVRGFNEALRVSGEDYDFHLRTCREGLVGLIDVASIQYQTGMPDRLTSSTYRGHASQNCLTTIQQVLRQDRQRICLSRSMIRARLAEVHEWVGDSLLNGDQAAEARGHLLKSLWYRPLQPRVLARLVRTSLPASVGNWLQRNWRRVKKAAPLRNAL